MRSGERAYSPFGPLPKEKKMVNLIKSLWNDESGQGLPEYALLVAAVVVMVVAAASLFANDVKDLFNQIGDYVDGNNAIDNPPSGDS